MTSSEIVIMLLIYSGLMTYFLVPNQSRHNFINHLDPQINFTKAYKDNFISIIFHKKAILALILLSLTLRFIWLVYAAEEEHFNAHSGYPPISNDLQAIYSMTGIFVYSVALVLLIAFLRTIRTR